MTKRSSGFGVLILFLIPFCLVGLGAGIGAVSFGIRRQWETAGLLAAFALCFGGAGFGLLGAALVGRRREAFTGRMRESHPDEPWVWRADWAAHRIEDSSRGGMIGAWAFAIFWNAISTAVAAVALRQALVSRDPKLLFVLIFPLVGLGLLAWAIRATSRYLTFGTSVLEVAGVPAPIGRLLAGVVHANSYLNPEDGFRLVLSCINRRVTGSGKNRSTTEEVLWQDERAIPRAIAGARGSDVPFVIPIAPGTRATDDSNPSSVILWRLEISAAVPGVDYAASFEVPVYQTAESSQPLSSEELERLDPAGSIGDFRQPAGSPIAVTETATGLEIYFPPARNLATGLGILAFTVIWYGVVVILVLTHAPLLFPIVFTLAGLIPLYGLYMTLLLSTTLRVERGRLTSTNSVAGMIGVGERVWKANEIRDLSPDMGLRSGTTVYYDLAVTDSGGNKRLLGRTIPSKREAEWLVGRIRGTLGLAEH